MVKNNIVILLAGGYGTRLYPLTYFIPKIFLPFKKKNLLEHHLHSLKNLNISKIYINLLKKNYNYTSKITGNKSDRVKFVYETKPWGSSRTIAKIMEKENFNNLIILYSDTLFYKNQSHILNKLIKTSNNKSISISISRSSNQKYLISKGIVKIKKNKLISFTEKPKMIKPKYSYFFSGIVVIPKIFRNKILKTLKNKEKKYEIIDFAEKIFTLKKFNIKVCVSQKIPLDFGNWKDLFKNYFKIK